MRHFVISLEQLNQLIRISAQTALDLGAAAPTGDMPEDIVEQLVPLGIVTSELPDTGTEVLQ